MIYSRQLFKKYNPLQHNRWRGFFNWHLDKDTIKGMILKHLNNKHMFSKKERAFCAHCEPLIEKHGRFSTRIIVHITSIINAIDSFFPTRSSGFYRFEKELINVLIKFLSKIRVIKIVPITNREEIQGRSLAIIDEAVKRGYTANLVKFFNRHFNMFQMSVKNKSFFFHVLPSLDSPENSVIDFSDKYLFKLLLKSNNLPHASGKAFKNINKALNYEREIGYPLVVKPRFGSLSRHTSTNIKNRDDLKEAIKIVKIITNEFIIERHIEGKNYRAVVIGNKMAACALREPPNVIGDGFNTIEQLIKIKNNNTLRGDYRQKNYTLKKITVTPRLEKLLEQKKYTLKNILAKGEKIYLDSKVILSGGADIHDVTDLVHKTNIELLENLSLLLKTPIVGFDFITADISKPHYDTTFTIIEANSAPYIDMHHFPISGTPRNIAEKIIDILESKSA